MRTATKVVSQHITDDRLVGFIKGGVELTDEEQHHMRDCENCNDRFRNLLTSSGNATEVQL